MKNSLLALTVSIILLFGLTACAFGGTNRDSSEQADDSPYSVKENVCMKDESGEVLLNAGHIETVQVTVTDGQPSVVITFTEEGKALFVAATAEYVGETLDICVGDTVVSSPTVVAAITDGKAAIPVDSIEEAEAMLEKMKE